MDAIIKTYAVKVVREADPSPITGNMFKRMEEDMAIDATSEKSAYQIAQILTTLTFRGQKMRVYIDGKEYFDERF